MSLKATWQLVVNHSQALTVELGPSLVFQAQISKQNLLKELSDDLETSGSESTAVDEVSQQVADDEAAAAGADREGFFGLSPAQIEQRIEASMSSDMKQALSDFLDTLGPGPDANFLENQGVTADEVSGEAAATLEADEAAAFGDAFFRRGLRPRPRRPRGPAGGRGVPQVRRVAPAVLVAALALAGCSHPAARSGTTTTLARSAAAGLSKARALLPPGFAAPGRAAPPPTVANLLVAPAAGFRASRVHLVPFPSRSAVRPILEAVVNLPVPLTVGPLFASTTVLQPGGTVTVAAARLAPGAAHPVLFVLQGPGYRGEHLVEAAAGVAAGVVHLPAAMTAGTWYFVVEDQSQLAPAAGGGVTGSAVVALAVLTVK